MVLCNHLKEGHQYDKQNATKQIFYKRCCFPSFFLILHPPSPYILKKDDPCYSKAALPQSRQTLLSEGILQVPIPFKNISHTLPVLLPILKRAVIKKDNRPIDQLSELRFN